MLMRCACVRVCACVCVRGTGQTFYELADGGGWVFRYATNGCEIVEVRSIEMSMRMRMRMCVRMCMRMSMA
jgi:hypothetical protein